MTDTRAAKFAPRYWAKHTLPGAARTNRVTVQSIADELGVTRQLISFGVNARRSVSEERARYIAQRIGIPLEDAFVREGD